MVVKPDKVWVISEVYYPDEQGGGHFMTKLAEGLARRYNVSVICGFPHYVSNQHSLPKREIHNNVNIERCFSTKFNKKLLSLRLINFITISISIFFKSLLRISKQDLVIVVTTPPSLPFVIAVACKLVQAKCILRIEDIYPETLIATGITESKSILARLMSSLNCWLYRGVDHITVLGRDMKQLVERKLDHNLKVDQITIVPNWTDLDLVAPMHKINNSLINELGLINKFVVQCAGNMGHAQGIENMFVAAEMLQTQPDIHFLFIGAGVKKEWMEKTVQDKHLKNITILGQRPRADQQNFLNACDIAIVSLISGMKGAAVPSRLYNIMAAGKPIIAIAEHDSEVSFVIKEEEIGWVTPPGEPNKLAEAILDAYSNSIKLEQMGARARLAVESKYTYNKGIESYRNLIEKLFSWNTI
jgi:colanic acid biosynthesis glycosyl transferase WcaI